MDVYNKFIDYFMDFNKVRKFQELCGLSEIQGKVEYPTQNGDKQKDASTTGIHERQRIASTSKSPQSCCDEESSAKRPTKNYTVNNKFLHQLFLIGSMLGTEVFYITVLPVIFWNLDVAMARMVITVWVVTMYLGQAAKDLLRWPRPTWPPAFKLETRVEAEYGLPSTHAIAATAVPFTLLFAATGRYNDVMAGIALTAVYLYFGWPFMEMVNDYTVYSQYAPFIIIVSHFLLAIFYPNSERWSTTRGDTVIILGVGAGVHCASWFGNYYGFDWDPVGTPPYDINMPTAHSLGIGLVRYAIGVLILLVIRATMKYLSLVVLCHAASVSKDDEMSRRRTEIEVPYKFFTYACVGFGANFLVPALLLYLGIVV